VLLQNAIYAGVPAANTAFGLAQKILAEAAGEIGYALEPADPREADPFGARRPPPAPMEN